MQTRVKFHSLLIAVAALVFVAPAHARSPASAGRAASIDYFDGQFTMRRVLDWGERPQWSPDGRRIVFTRSDIEDGPAYELNLGTGKMTCLTCRWGANGLVTRIFYLADGSFLIEANTNLETSTSERGGGASATALYWMPADSGMPPQSLQARAIGDIAILRDALPDGGVRVAWGSVSTEGAALMIGDLVHDGHRAVLTNRRTAYANSREHPDPRATFPEAYDFLKGGKAINFWTPIPSKLESAMYTVSLADGTLTRLPSDGAHNEVHVFPDEVHGLEESNRASDPSGPVRGLSSLPASVVSGLLRMRGTSAEQIDPAKNSTKPFDLFVTALGGSRPPRRLTFLSDRDGEAHQSSPAADGRRIVFAVRAPASGPLTGQSGLYIGEFEPVSAAVRKEARPPKLNPNRGAKPQE